MIVRKFVIFKKNESQLIYRRSIHAFETLNYVHKFDSFDKRFQQLIICSDTCNAIRTKYNI